MADLADLVLFGVIVAGRGHRRILADPPDSAGPVSFGSDDRRTGASGAPRGPSARRSRAGVLPGERALVGAGLPPLDDLLDDGGEAPAEGGQAVLHPRGDDRVLRPVDQA